MSACCDHTCAAGKITGRKVREPQRGSDPARALKADKRGRKKCLAGVSLLIAAACLLFSGCTPKEGESSGKAPEIADVCALLAAPYRAECEVSYADAAATVMITQDSGGVLRMEVTAPQALAGFAISADDRGAHLAFRDMEISLDALPEGMVNAYTLFHTVREKTAAGQTLPAFTPEGGEGLYSLHLAESPLLVLYVDETGVPVRVSCDSDGQIIKVEVKSFVPGA